MSYQLRLKKGVRFNLYCDEEYESTVDAIPTSRKVKDGLYYSLQATIEVMKHLVPLVEKGEIEPDHEASTKLQELHKKYLVHRQAVRSAGIHYKRNIGSTDALPMRHKPFEHQERAIGFGLGVDNSGLFMDTGTGKTYCTIAIAGVRFLKNLVKRLFLAVPKSAIPVWERQLKEHAAFPYSLGVAEKKMPQMDSKGLQIIITNYDRVKKLMKDIYKWKPDMAVADESQRIKEHTTGRSKAMHFLGKHIQRKMVLTATPLGQSPLDCFSQLKFAEPSVFGSDYRAFEERYAIKGGYFGHEILGYQNLPDLAHRLHSVSFRCKLSECRDMPPERSVRLYCEASPELRRIYDELDTDFLTGIDDDSITVDIVVAKMMKLRQLTGGLVKTDGGSIRKVSEEKATLLKRHLKGRPDGAKQVVFCSFLHEIDLCLKVCKELGIKAEPMTGKTTTVQRGLLERDFQETNRFQTMVCQVDVGGEAMDMFAADESIFYSPTFSFIKYYQARGRVYRLGQTKPVKNVHLLIKNTVDEDVMNFIRDHGDLTSMILDEMRDYRLRRQ